ncbi:MAG: TIGR01841 family phasin [Hyphomicrobiales bacterium]|nr:TIGR01841 family phasin [Hyphomicrobiales bacterium]
MANEIQSYVEMLRNFASSVGLPQVDVDKLIETNRKNIAALAESAKVAAGAADSMAQKQREVLQAGLREAQAFARDFKPLGDARENLARQTEFVRKVFDVSVQGARETADVSRQSTAEAARIIQERMKASLEELRGSLRRAQPGAEKPKT